MKRFIVLSTLLLAVVACKKKEEKKDPAPATGTAPATGSAPATGTGAATGTAAVPEPPPLGDYKIIKPGELKWGPMNPNGPGPEMAVVSGDPATGPVSFFIRIPPKGDSGLHTHTSNYRAVLISGSHTHWLAGEKDVKPVGPGSWWFQPGGQAHGDRCEGPDPCIGFVMVEGKFDAAPAPDVKKVEPGAYKLVRAEDMKFARQDPAATAGPEFSFIDGDPAKGPVAFELQFGTADNAAVPVHNHTAGYDAVVLSGAPAHWVDGHEGKEAGLEVGTFWHQPGGQFHGDQCTGADKCKLFIWISGPMDFIPKP